MTVITRPEVGQVWVHRTINPAHQDYKRQVTIRAAGLTHVVVKGVHESTWVLDRFVRAYEYAYTPEAEEDPQLALDLEPLVVPTYAADATIQQRFELFHAENPWVLRAYEKLAADWVAKGNKRLGIGMLTEIIRWQYGRQTTGADFKINNNYRSRYVRLILERNPGWAGLFETRHLDAHRLRKSLGRADWLAPTPHGPDGFRLVSRDQMSSVIVSCSDGMPGDPAVEWVHASIARPTMPTYEDLVMLHQAVWPHGGYAYQVFAPPNRHVNIHATALHLWGRLDGANVLPDFGAGGTI